MWRLLFQLAATRRLAGQGGDFRFRQRPAVKPYIGQGAGEVGQPPQPDPQGSPGREVEYTVGLVEGLGGQLAIDVQLEQPRAPDRDQVGPANRQVFFRAGHLSEVERADPAERAVGIAVGSTAPTGASAREKPSLETGQDRKST